MIHVLMNGIKGILALVPFVEKRELYLYSLTFITAGVFQWFLVIQKIWADFVVFLVVGLL